PTLVRLGLFLPTMDLKAERRAVPPITGADHHHGTVRWRMVMPLSASFDYLVKVRRGGVPWRAALHPDDAAARERWRRSTPNLDPALVDPRLGPRPSVEIAGGTVTIGGSFAFDVDPGMLACLRPGDVLRMARTGAD